MRSLFVSLGGGGKPVSMAVSKKALGLAGLSEWRDGSRSVATRYVEWRKSSSKTDFKVHHTGIHGLMPKISWGLVVSKAPPQQGVGYVISLRAASQAPISYRGPIYA